MAKFRFSLEQVLNYRSQLEDEAKVRLGKIQADLMAATQKLEDLQNMLKEQEQSLYSGKLDMHKVWLCEQYAKGLRSDIAQTANIISSLHKEEAAARKDLIAKAKDRKILDKFKEKQEERFLHEEQLKEQKNYDEIASIRFKAAAF